jgi:hypothetical protein
MYDLEGRNDVDPLETPYTGSKLDLIQILLQSIPRCARPRDLPVLVHRAGFPSFVFLIKFHESL